MSKWIGAISRALLVFLLIAAILVAYVPGFAPEGTTHEHAQTILSIYLATTLAINVIEGSRKS